MGLRRSEDNLIRSSSDGRSNDLAGLIQCLRGKPTWAVQSRRIGPSGLLCIYPRLPGGRE
jgi:hypothetical protein